MNPSPPALVPAAASSGVDGPPAIGATIDRNGGVTKVECHRTSYHLTALPNSRQSCGSVPMFGNTANRASRPSSDEPASFEHPRRSDVVDMAVREDAVHGPDHAAPRRAAMRTTSDMIPLPPPSSCPSSSRSSRECSARRQPQVPIGPPPSLNSISQVGFVADVEDFGDDPAGLADVGMRASRSGSASPAGSDAISREQRIGVVEPRCAQRDARPIIVGARRHSLILQRWRDTICGG